MTGGGFFHKNYKEGMCGWTRFLEQDHEYSMILSVGPLVIIRLLHLCLSSIRVNTIFVLMECQATVSEAGQL